MNSGIVISDCYKTYRHDQDKVKSPAETVRWVRACLAGQSLKLLTETKRIDTGRLDIPIYLSLCGEDATRLTGTKKQMGKGATPIQSEASALMELIERFSFFSFMHHSLFRFTIMARCGSRAVSPAALTLSLHDSRSPLERCRVFLQDFPMRWAVAQQPYQQRSPVGSHRLVLPDQRIQRPGCRQLHGRSHPAEPL